MAKITATPNPATPGGEVTITWSSTRGRRLRILWSTGTQVFTVSARGTKKVAVPAAATGDTKIQLKYGTSVLAMILLGLGDVTEPEPDPGPNPPPPPPPPPPPDPEPPPPGTGDFTPYGFGAVSTGGTGGTVINVDTEAELRAACGQTGKRIVTWVGSITAPLMLGSDINVHGLITLDLRGLQIGAKSLKAEKGETDWIIRNGRFMPGGLNGYQEDAFTAGDFSGTELQQRFLFQHCEFAWAPDVNAVMNGRNRFVTYQDCAFYEGLYDSPHPEATPTTPHSLSLNLEGVPDSGRDAPAYYTLFRCMFAFSESRSPRSIGTKQLEMYNCLLVDNREGPQGNPTSARIEGNRYIRIGTWNGEPLAYRNNVWRYQQDASYVGTQSGQVYENDNTSVGFTLDHSGAIIGGSPLFNRSSPLPALMASTAVEAYVLANVGALPRASYLQTLCSDVAARRARPHKDSVGQYPPVNHT